MMPPHQCNLIQLTRLSNGPMEVAEVRVTVSLLIEPGQRKGWRKVMHPTVPFNLFDLFISPSAK